MPPKPVSRGVVSLDRWASQLAANRDDDGRTFDAVLARCTPSARDHDGVVDRYRRQAMQRLGDDDDVTVDVIELSLICPLTKQRLQWPVRGADCQHTDCFDLRAYFPACAAVKSKRDPSMPCPFAECGQLVFASSLLVDWWLKAVVDSPVYAACRKVQLRKHSDPIPVGERSRDDDLSVDAFGSQFSPTQILRNVHVKEERMTQSVPPMAAYGDDTSPHTHPPISPMEAPPQFTAGGSFIAVDTRRDNQMPLVGAATCPRCGTALDASQWASQAPNASDELLACCGVSAPRLEWPHVVRDASFAIEMLPTEWTTIITMEPRLARFCDYRLQRAGFFPSTERCWVHATAEPLSRAEVNFLEPLMRLALDGKFVDDAMEWNMVPPRFGGVRRKASGSFFTQGSQRRF